MGPIKTLKDLAHFFPESISTPLHRLLWLACLKPKSKIRAALEIMQTSDFDGVEAQALERAIVELNVRGFLILEDDLMLSILPDERHPSTEKP